MLPGGIWKPLVPCRGDLLLAGWRSLTLSHAEPQSSKERNAGLLQVEVGAPRAPSAQPPSRP